MLDLLYALAVHLSQDVAINEFTERQQRLRPLLIRVPGAHLHGNGPTPGHRPQVLDAWWEEKRRACLTPSKRKCSFRVPLSRGSTSFVLLWVSSSSSSAISSQQPYVSCQRRAARGRTVKDIFNGGAVISRSGVTH